MVDGQSSLTDIGVRGYLLSGIVVAAATLALHGLLIYLLLSGYAGTGAWGRKTIVASLRCYELIWAAAKGWLG